MTAPRPARLSKTLFGGTLAPQGRGFYVTLELLALCKGALHLARRTGRGGIFGDPVDDGAVRFDRWGHDLARRLLHRRLGGQREIDPAHLEALTGGENTAETTRWLSDLFLGLTVPRPGTRALPDWGGFHLYPYVGELIHYDAVYRRQAAGHVSIERYAYRGGGAIAYQLLRTDRVAERRARLAIGLERLVADSGTPLGLIARAVASHDAAPQPPPSVDETVEPHDEARETSWSEQLRSGCLRILESPASRQKQVQLLMHWVPYALCRHQLELSHRSTQSPSQQWYIPIDFVGASVRRHSQRQLDLHLRTISDALSSQGDAAGTDTSKPLASEVQATTRFYSSSLAAIGALNANTGRRHYTFKSPLLEAVVFAALDSDDQIPFSQFVDEILGERFRIIVGPRNRDSAMLPASVSNTLLRENEASLGAMLTGLGLMTSLSDATRMVGATS